MPSGALAIPGSLPARRARGRRSGALRWALGFAGGVRALGLADANPAQAQSEPAAAAPTAEEFGDSEGVNGAVCPRGAERWVDVFFAGSAWTEAQRQAVLRELRTELGRRALQVCHRTLLPASPSANELTLVAIGPDEVRIMPARLNGESAWEGGRTMRLARLPEDARPLAIALAADEALRGRPRRDPPKPAVQTPAPKPLRAAPTTRPHLDIGATVRVALLTGAGPRIIPLTPGASLRAGLTRAGWGGSVGTVLSPSTKWTFDSNDFQQLRLPFDLSATKTFPAGPFNAMLEAGVVLAFLHLEYSGTGKTLEQFEAGGRLGFSLSWGRRTLVPLLGASLEVMPTAHDLRLTPVGSVGHTAQLWAGITIGLEARFE